MVEFHILDYRKKVRSLKSWGTKSEITWGTKSERRSMEEYEGDKRREKGGSKAEQGGEGQEQYFVTYMYENIIMKTIFCIPT